MNLICAEIIKTNNTTGMPSFGDTAKLSRVLKNESNEVFILNTCHRFLLLIRNECKLLVDKFFDELNINGHPVFSYGEDALNHFLSVASGVDSPVLGENEILGQIKKGFEEAKQLKTVSFFLSELLAKAIFTGKRVRTETELSKLSGSYASLTHQLIKSHCSIRGQKVLIFGTGELGQQLFQYFNKKTSTTLVSRSQNRAKEVEEELGTCITLDIARETVVDYDVVIGAMETEGTILTIEYKMLKNKVLIDLGMPQNFRITNVSEDKNIYSLKDIHQSMQLVNQSKIDEIPKVMAIVQQEADNFKYWFNARKVVPAIQSFNRFASAVKEEEYNWAINKMGDLNSQQKEILQKLVYRIVSRMTSKPISKIKDYAQERGNTEQIEVFLDMFNIKE